MDAFDAEWGEELRATTERLLAFDTTDGREAPAQAWLADRLAEWGFDVVEWTADADRLATHPSFPDDPDEIAVADRPSVAGVLEFGDPDAGETLVLNGHVDVVPAERAAWDGDPFEPTWDGDALTARGAADMKAGLAACVFAARHVAATDPEFDGRLVVESVVGEEEGGIGAAAAALDSPYEFERDAAVVAEPTELAPVTTVEGCLMVRIGLVGRSAHAATRWRGESVLPAFEQVREALEELERDRHERVTHPLYGEFPIAWPIVIGRVDAGSWASTVPAELTAEVRIGVAPGESVATVEDEVRERLAAVAERESWPLAAAPTVERFSIQFEPAAIDADEPVVGAVQDAMERAGLTDTAPRGATYGADNRHYVAAGIPTVVFGPGSIDQAHFPNETVDWNEVVTAGAVLAESVRSYLG